MTRIEQTLTDRFVCQLMRGDPEIEVEFDRSCVGCELRRIHRQADEVCHAENKIYSEVRVKIMNFHEVAFTYHYFLGGGEGVHRAFGHCALIIKEPINLTNPFQSSNIR